MSKVAIVGTVGVPACYGGFETLVDNLLAENEIEHDITVYCSSKRYEERPSRYKNASLCYLPLNANGVQSIPYDILSLLHACFSKQDNILVLGVSGAVFFPLLKLLTKAQIITNIDGLEWRRDKWGSFAKRFLKYSEKMAVKYSDIVVSDNQGIADYVKEEYQRDSTIIAYGGDHAVTKELKNIDDHYALALCRIEPENNVEMILEGFSKTSNKLKFIGNWNNSEFGLSMKEKYKQFANIEIIDPIYDVGRLFEIRDKCTFYVHGHSAGGTNPSLVEMMHFGKNILSFDCIYNRATTEDTALFFSDVTSIINQINNIGSIDNASKIKEIAKRRYTWGVVKKQYFDLFE